MIEAIYNKKFENLKAYLRSLGSLAVAYSSGVDSTFLLKVAHDVLGDKAIAITAIIPQIDVIKKKRIYLQKSFLLQKKMALSM